ncbi:MAG: hypothetical protein AABY62_02205 [Pseudomonadota bacterium]
MNKKSLVQILILVVLLAAGGGAYFVMQQEKGLDGLLEMVGLGSSTSTPDATATPAKSGMQRREKPGADAGPAPAIPAHPAKGKYQGKDFTVAEAVVDSGTLILRPEGGAFVEVRVVPIGNERWAMPAGKKTSLVKASGASAPRIEVVTREPDGKTAENKYKDQYTLLLEYGPLKDGKLAGKLYLELPAAAKLSVGGTFEARVGGFHIVDGKPDLSADSPDTLEYLTLLEILKAGPDQELKNAMLRDMRVHSEGTKPSGYLEASYALGDAAPVTRRFQFAKAKDTWQVVRELRVDQIDEAHPVSKPSAKDKPETILAYLSAVKLEKDLNNKFKKKGIYVAEFKTRYNLKSKLGQCEVTYRVEGNDTPATVAYLFRQGPQGWRLDRQLGDKERLNADNGRIEKRK